MVRAEPEGRRVLYQLIDPRLEQVLSDLLRVVLVAHPETCPASESNGCC